MAGAVVVRPAAPPQPAKPTPVEKAKAVEKAIPGVHLTDDPLDYDAILELLARNGADTSDPETQLFAHGVANTDNYQTQIGQIQGNISFLPKLSLPVYQQVVQVVGGPAGIDDLLFPKVAPTSPGQAQLFAHEPGARPTEDMVDLKDRGVLVWKNGVIVNYGNPDLGSTTGGVMVFYDDADPKQEGSYAWQRKVQQQWSPEQVKAWRIKLFQAGYLTSRKGEGWDGDLISATKAYYDAKYMYGAEVADRGSPSAATGTAGAAKPADIAALIEKNKATIRSSIIAQYLSVFNKPPNDAELHSWTGFVVRQATELATGKVSQRLTPSQAINQAQAEAASKIFSSPQGQLVYESDRENTSLHDALTTAISATRGLA